MATMFWVNARDQTINLANADEIEIDEIDEYETDYENGETHVVQAIWFGSPDNVFVLFAGTKQDCDIYKKRLDSMMGATNISDLLRGRSFTD